MPVVYAHYLPDNYEAVLEAIQQIPTLKAHDAQSAHTWLCQRLALILDEAVRRGANPLDGRLRFPSNRLACVFTAIAQPFGPRLELTLQEPIGAEVLEIAFYAYLC